MGVSGRQVFPVTIRPAGLLMVISSHPTCSAIVTSKSLLQVLFLFDGGNHDKFHLLNRTREITTNVSVGFLDID